jgi:hypothetical protein
MVNNFPGGLNTQAEVLALILEHAVKTGLLTTGTNGGLESIPAPTVVLPKAQYQSR